MSANEDNLLLKVINDQSLEIVELESQNRTLTVLVAIGFGLSVMLGLVIYYKSF